jgi:hypothetical protein
MATSPPPPGQMITPTPFDWPFGGPEYVERRLRHIAQHRRIRGGAIRPAEFDLLSHALQFEWWTFGPEADHFVWQSFVRQG